MVYISQERYIVIIYHSGLELFISVFSSGACLSAVSLLSIYLLMLTNLHLLLGASAAGCRVLGMVL